MLPLVQHHREAPAPTRASTASSLLSRPAGQSVTGRPSQWTRRMKRRTGLCSRGPLSSVEPTHRPTTRAISVGWILSVSAAVFSVLFFFRGFFKILLCVIVCLLLSVSICSFVCFPLCLSNSPVLFFVCLLACFGFSYMFSSFLLEHYLSVKD